jgi:hypothetical protein
MEGHLLADCLTRYATQVRVRYRRASESTYRPEGGRTCDLSVRGAWVELPERVAARSALVIALETPEGALPLVAHVAWTCPEVHEPPYLHGLRFTGVTPYCRDRVQALLAHENPQRAARLYCGLAATCQRKGVPCPLMPSSIRDLSDSGVGLRIPEPVAPGTELCIRTATAFGQIAADAKVVWTDETPQLPRGALYRHGLRFLRLDTSSDLPLQALLCGVR